MATSEAKTRETLTQRPSNQASIEPSLSILESAAETRVAIEGVWPEIDAGRFEIKRSVGDVLTVEADIFSDGHDKLGAALLYRRQDDSTWHEVPMRFIDNDRWRGEITLSENCRYAYTIAAWRDVFASWRDDVSKKAAAGQDIAVELDEGRRLVETVLKGHGVAEANRRVGESLTHALAQRRERQREARALGQQRGPSANGAPRAARQSFALRKRARRLGRPPPGRL